MPSLSQCRSDGSHDAHTPEVAAAIVSVIEEKNIQMARPYTRDMFSLEKGRALTARARRE